MNETNIPLRSSWECLNFILLLAQDEIIQGQTCLLRDSLRTPELSELCPTAYSEGDPGHTEGNERNMPKAQTSLFSHIIPSLPSLSPVQWHSGTEWSILRNHSHYYFVRVMTVTVTLYIQKGATEFCSHNLKTFWKQELLGGKKKKKEKDVPKISS